MKITVLMPTYNSGRYIYESIKSILNQTFGNFEFIILNDGSTDQTEEIISIFHDQRIVYKKKEHTGLSDTLNFGLNLVQTELVARMDSDDIADIKRLQYQFNFISNNPDCDIIGSNINVINKSNQILYRLNYPENDLEIKKKLLVNSVIPHAAVLMKKSVFNKVGYYSNQEGIIEDYDFWLRSLNKLKFYNIQHYLYSYRRYEDSKTGSFQKFILEREKVFNMMERFISENHKLYFITDSEKDCLNAKFLIRYSPHLEINKIFSKLHLSIFQKLFFSVILIVPFKLRSFYFFFNPKKRILFHLEKLFSA